MKTPNNLDRLRHAINAIDKIERYPLGLDFTDFEESEEKIDAVIRNVEVIGEAVAGLTLDLKAKHSDVDWRLATAMRNRLIHGYFEVDAEIVWKTTQEKLPKFKREIEQIVRILEQEYAA